MPGRTSSRRLQSGVSSRIFCASSGRSGRGPTTLMSPRRTLMNWGTSSRPVLRINRPARVMRGSSSPLLRHAPVGPSAWSAGKISTRTHILQYSNGQTVGGASVDLNESKQADFGAWGILAPVPAPASVPAPTIQPAAKLSVAQQWAIDQGIMSPPVDWDGQVDYNILAWALMKARGKI